MSEPEIKTFRGSSIEELLPQIRDELGPDAVIMRQREGIVGGVGGFFGKKCVEVDVAPPTPAAQTHGPAVPRGTLVDTYDTGTPRAEQPLAFDFDEHALDLDDEHALDLAQDEPEPHDGDLMGTLLAQASPFADQLAHAWETELFTAPATHGGADAVRRRLADAGVPERMAASVVDDAERLLRPFAFEQSVAELAREALARRIPLDLGGGAPRRIALVGAASSGRTLAAAKLCGAYARGGSSVCAVSLEQARRAFELAAVTEPFGVALETADDPSTIALVRRRLKAYDVVVADTPAVDVDEPASLARLAGLLRALQPTETVLVLPADTSGEAARLLVRELRQHVRLRSLLVSRVDGAGARGTAVGLSLAEKLPFSYISDGPLAGAGIRVARADELARMVL
jgi:flagellar biosynthesis GTPase FlhF